MFDYSPFWKTIKRKNITTYQLINKYKVSPTTITKLKHNKNMTILTLEKLCDILDVSIVDIVNVTNSADN